MVRRTRRHGCRAARLLVYSRFMGQRLLVIRLARWGQRRSAGNAVLRGWPNRGVDQLPVRPRTGTDIDVQATLLTGTPTAQRHGIVANGWYFRDLSLVLNWQRSARLMSGETLWDAARGEPRSEGGQSVLALRDTLVVRCGTLLSGRPTGPTAKSPDIYTEPAGVRDELVAQLRPLRYFVSGARRRHRIDSLDRQCHAAFARTGPL